MSGRSGFRKTDRRVERRPRQAAHLLPEKRLTFRLPAALAFSVAKGPTGIMGVTVDELGQVEVKGRDRAWMFEQAAAFLQKIGRGHCPMVVEATFETPPEPPLTIDAPGRPGGLDAFQIAIVSGEPAIVVTASKLEPRIFASRVVQRR